MQNKNSSNFALFKNFINVLLLLILDPIAKVFSLSVHQSKNSFHCQRQVLASQNNDQEYNRPRYRSIGEVVGGLHGGKYQFVDSYGGGAMGYMDQSFAGEGSFQSSGCGGIEDDEEMPRWAEKMSLPVNLSIQNCESIQVPSNSNPMDGMVYSVTVTVKNEERTWERFYTKITNIKEKKIDSDNLPFYVNPSNGYLAPRGGASNACDESSPYSDSVNLCVLHNENYGDEITSEGEWWLIVGTEEEKWYYKLQLQ